MSTHRVRRGSWRTHLSATTSLIVFLTACAATLVSVYDEPTDRMVTALQRTVDSFLVSLAREPRVPGCTYERNKRFYTDALTGVGSLEVRNRARPKNEITVEQIGELDKGLVTLEQLHRVKGDAACLSDAEIQPLRSNFNTIFTAILTLELAKQREQ